MGFNPCAFVLGTNGITLLYGHWDAEPEFQAQVEDLVSGSATLEALNRFADFRPADTRRKGNKQAQRFGKSIRPDNLAGSDALVKFETATQQLCRRAGTSAASVFHIY